MMEKGQAFSVFQLLISAIVAFAILYILLTIIPTGGFVGSEPTQVAKQLIGDRLRYPGSAKDSDVVRFTKGSNITAKAVAKETGITASQIILCRGDFVDNTDFDIKGEPPVLIYNGSALDVKIRVICDSGDDIGGDIETYMGSGLTDLGCQPESVSGGKTYCAVILLYRG